MIPGSHKQGVLEHDNVQDPNLLNRRGERLRMDVDESQAVDVVLKPGEMSLHHTNIVHGSNPNTSDGPRIGFIVRFVTNLSTNRDRQVMRVRATRIAVICGWWSRRQASARDLANGRFLLLVGALGSDIGSFFEEGFSPILIPRVMRST